MGAGVEEAKRLCRRVRSDKKLLGALLLFGASDRIIDRYAVQGDFAVGWDVDGKEVVRVPFTEPFVVRDAFDAAHQTYRHNIT